MKDHYHLLGWLGLTAMVLQTSAQLKSSNSSMPTAVIAGGRVVGTTTTISAATAPVNKFLGIPFAQSPPRRFSPAEPAGPFNGTFNAQRYGPSCVQQIQYPPEAQVVIGGLFNTPPPPAGESEDCLYLNVFAPSGPPPPEGRAVMFWIFGGGLQLGSGTLASYDGSALAAYEDVILVTHNYRTNVFGFLAPSEIPAKDRNLGLLDSRLALQWVQDNIHAFGGNRSKVTIFGESSGGFAVDALITSLNPSNAPFRAAIMQSGQASFNAAPVDNATNDGAVLQLAQYLNCTGNTLACLRAAPAATLKNIIEVNSLSFPAVTENFTVMSDRAARRLAGRIVKVPTLIGTNADEGRLFALFSSMNITDYVQSTIGTAKPDLVQPVLNAFPTSSSVSDFDQIGALITLLGFQCGSAYLANTTHRNNIPTWRYLYNATFPNLSPFNGLLRAFHSSEIPFPFQSYPGGPANPVLANDTSALLPQYLPPTAQEYSLGRFIGSAWANFAKNPMLGPGWGQVGSFSGVDMAVLGGSTGLAAGAEITNSGVVDAKCRLLKPLFEEFSRVTLS